MKVTSIKISASARDDAARLSGDAKSARAFVEELIQKFKDGELVAPSSEGIPAETNVITHDMVLDIRADVARTHQLMKLIGLHITGDDEGIENALNLLTNEFGNCPSCNEKLTCPCCGCYVSDHVFPEVDDETNSETTTE